MLHNRRLLQRRGPIYYFRQRVPRPLVQAVGRVEVMRSLRTADHREALRRAALIEQGLARRWAALARRGDLMRLDDREVERLAEDFYESLVAKDRGSRAGWRAAEDVDSSDEGDPLESQIFAYWDLLQEETERMQRGDRRAVKEAVEEVAAGRDLDQETLERLAFAMQRALTRYLRDMGDEWEADFSGKPRNTLGKPMSGTGASVARATARRINEAVAVWLREEGPRWKKNTFGETRHALAWFVQVVGDIALDDVKREDVMRFRATLERVPRGTPATTSIGHLVDAELPPREQRRGEATVAKMISRCVAFFSWAEDRRWITANPAVGLVKRHRGRSKREPFTTEELRQIFSADYAELESRTPARFWVPVLALYTGARRGELVQLLVADVREVEGVLVLDLNEGESGDGKSLKTSASRRKVPVHSHLIQLGFRKFVDGRKREGAQRLFPDVREGTGGRWGDEVGKWFTRWRRMRGVPGKNKPLHAMRNTVVTALRRASVQLPVQKALVGHEDEDITSGLYAQAPSLSEVRSAVETLDWREPLTALFERRHE